MRWAYGFGSAANGVNSKVLGAFVLIFYHQVVGLDPGTVSLIITFALIVDAVVAPLIGLVSDNLISRWGRRHPFMAIAMILYPVAFVLLWNPPGGLTSTELGLWLLATLVAVRVLDTLYELPCSALLPELVRDYDERTKLAALRYCIGVATATTVSLLAYNVFMREGSGGSGGIDERPGWTGFSVTCALIALAAIASSTLATFSRVPGLRKPIARRLNPAVLLSELAGTLGSRSFLVTTAFGGLAAVATGLNFALNVYFLLYFWGLSQAQMGLLTIGTLMAAAMALTAAPWLGRRLGKRRAAMILAVLSCLACNGPLLARVVFDVMPANGSGALFAILFLQAMIFPACTAGYSILLTSMIADMVEEAERRTGRRSEGLLHAAETLFKRIISGGGTLAAGWILKQVAFPADAARTGAPDETLQAMGLLYIPMSVSFSAMAIVVMSFYRLDRQTHQANLRWLDGDKTATEWRTTQNGPKKAPHG